MKKLKVYLLVALAGFFITSFIYPDGTSFGFPYAVYGRWIGNCPRIPIPIADIVNNPCRQGISWGAIIFDSFFWLVFSFIFVNLYRDIKNTPRHLLKYFSIALTGFFLTSLYAFFSYSRYIFGFPFAVYFFPFDCGYSPNSPCEGFIWDGLIYSTIFWFTSSYVLVQLYDFLKRNYQWNLNLNLTLKQISFPRLILGLILSLIILVFIAAGFLREYMRQEAYCGGLTGKACPLGFYCPDYPYPDAMMKCVSPYEFFRQSF